MRILYVSVCWPGLYEALYEGRAPYGMPGFFRVLEELCIRNHDIDFLLYGSHKVKENLPERNDGVIWIKHVRVKDYVIYRGSRGIADIWNSICGTTEIYRKTVALCKESHYDMIYGQGPMSEGANFAAKRFNVPFVQRRYGDDYAVLLRDRGMLYAMLRNPITTLSYRLSKKMMIATNDGTRLDLVAKRLNHGRAPFPIYLWTNGYPDNLTTNSTVTESEEASPYMLHVGRFVSVKGQKSSIQLLSNIKKKGGNCRLCFAGAQHDMDYYRGVMQMAQDLGVDDLVEYIGDICPEEMQRLVRGATANLLLGVNFNMNNVFIETMTYGGIVITRTGQHMDDEIQNGENGFLVSDMEQAADIVIDLLGDAQKREKIRIAAAESARKLFLPWNERAKMEADLLESAIE